MVSDIFFSPPDEMLDTRQRSFQRDMVSASHDISVKFPACDCLTHKLSSPCSLQVIVFLLKLYFWQMLRVLALCLSDNQVSFFVLFFTIL